MQKGVILRKIKELHDVYGEVVRIAPTELSFTAPAAMRDIQSSGPGRLGFARSEILFESKSVEGIFTSNNADHSRIRKALWRALSPNALTTREERLQSYVDLFVEKLRETIRGGERVGTPAGHSTVANINIVSWFDFIAFDVVSDLAFGEPFGCLHDTTYHPLVGMICSHVKALGLIFSIRFYPALYKLLLRLIPKSVLEESKRFSDFVTQKVQRRLNDPSQQNEKDIISILQGDEKDKEARMGEITTTLNTLVIAGSETTATVLTGTVNHLCQNPDILRELVKEIRSFKSEPDMTPTALKQLPFLSAVLKEGLRMCHPICIGLARTVPPEGANINHHWVPGNVSEAIS